jgi:hypothetical protein
MADVLTEMLKRLARERFVWGETDCGMSVLRYLSELYGDFSLLGRYRYGSEEEARAFGPLADLAEAAARHFGLKETDAPARGDVGLLALPVGTTCCLHAGSRWTAPAPRGVAAFKGGRLIKAWRVPCPK